MGVVDELELHLRDPLPGGWFDHAARRILGAAAAAVGQVVDLTEPFIHRNSSTSSLPVSRVGRMPTPRSGGFHQSSGMVRGIGLPRTLAAASRVRRIGSRLRSRRIGSSIADCRRPARRCVRRCRSAMRPYGGVSVVTPVHSTDVAVPCRTICDRAATAVPVLLPGQLAPNRRCVDPNVREVHGRRTASSVLGEPVVRRALTVVTRGAALADARRPRVAMRSSPTSMPARCDRHRRTSTHSAHPSPSPRGHRHATSRGSSRAGQRLRLPTILSS